MKIVLPCFVQVISQSVNSGYHQSGVLCSRLVKIALQCFVRVISVAVRILVIISLVYFVADLSK